MPDGPGVIIIDLILAIGGVILMFLLLNQNLSMEHQLREYQRNDSTLVMYQDTIHGPVIIPE